MSRVFIYLPEINIHEVLGIIEEVEFGFHMFRCYSFQMYLSILLNILNI